MKWEKIKLSSLCNRIISGGTPKSDEASYYSDGTIPWLRTQEVTFNRIYDTDIKISENGFNNSNAKWVKENSVIVAMYGNSAGRTAIAKIPLTTNQACCNLEINESEADYNFIYYKLLSEFETLKGLSKGAAQNNLNANDIKEFIISTPPLATQRKIASILSAYDDLIENNLKRIKLLEEKASLRYMQIVREEQQEKHILSEFGDIITGKTPSTTIADYFGDDVPFIKTPDMHNQIFVEHTDQMLSELGAKSQEKKFLPPLSLCVSCIGTAGVIGITSKPSQTNQQINSIVFYDPKNVYYFYALMSRMKEQLDALGSNGSTFTNVNKNKFENMEVSVPNQKVLKDFAQEFETPFNLILALQKQNTKLREARDILLPRLICGQIEV
jgi:type I restriction enzyme S subunit